MQVSMGPSTHLWFCAFKRASLAPKLQVSMGFSLTCGFVHSQQRHYDQNYKSLWVPDLTYGFCMHNSVISTRITSLSWSQTSPVVLCMHNSVISTRITSLYRSQPSPVVLCMQTSVNSIGITCLHEFQHSSVVFACKTATFVSDLHVCMGLRIRLLICEWKTACLDPEWQLSLSSQPSSVVLCIQSSDFSIRNTSLHGSQTSPVVLCMQNNVISIRITSLYGSLPSSVVFACKRATLASVLKCPRTYLSFCACKRASLASERLVSMSPSTHLWFLHAKQSILDQNYNSVRVPDIACWIVNAKQRA